MYKTHWLLYEIHFDSSCIMILVSLNLHQGVHNNDGYTYKHITECVILAKSTEDIIHLNVCTMYMYLYYMYLQSSNFVVFGSLLHVYVLP